MTDKQIIIDDVYVYKCVNAKRSIFGIYVECRLGGDCSQNPNCYYKQLKRAENQIVEINKMVEAKEQECGKLTSENKHLNDLLNNALKELEKTRETLTEIKEIAEENDELLQGYHKEWANNKLILQKISECEGNDE